MRNFILLIFALFGVSQIVAQSLQTDDLLLLANKVKQQYSITMMEGSSVFKTRHGNVLVSLVSVKQDIQMKMQRIAQVKASRSAGEFLQSATNKSITIYEIIENNQYSINDSAKENATTNNTKVNTKNEQQTTDSTFRQSEENLSDKIIQSSLTQVTHMSPLTRFPGEDGLQIFAFYIFLK